MDVSEIDALLLAYDKLEGLPDTERLYFDPSEKYPDYGNNSIRTAFKIGYQAAIDGNQLICNKRLLHDLMPCIIVGNVKHARHIDANGAVWPA